MELTQITVARFQITANAAGTLHSVTDTAQDARVMRSFADIKLAERHATMLNRNAIAAVKADAQIAEVTKEAIDASGTTLAAARDIEETRIDAQAAEHDAAVLALQEETLSAQLDAISSEMRDAHASQVAETSNVVRAVNVSALSATRCLSHAIKSEDARSETVLSIWQVVPGSFTIANMLTKELFYAFPSLQTAKRARRVMRRDDLATFNTAHRGNVTHVYAEYSFSVAKRSVYYQMATRGTALPVDTATATLPVPAVAQELSMEARLAAALDGIASHDATHDAALALIPIERQSAIIIATR